MKERHHVAIRRNVFAEVAVVGRWELEWDGLEIKGVLTCPPPRLRIGTNICYIAVQDGRMIKYIEV